MVVIDEAHLRQLASLDLGRGRVTTCYLDLDGRRLPGGADVEIELRRVLADGRARAKGDPSVLEDLRRIEAHVRAGIDRSDSRGLVMVCASTASLWEAIPVPLSLRSQLVIAPAPALGQLEALVHEAEVVALVVLARDRARVVVFQLGAVVVHRELAAPSTNGTSGSEVGSRATLAHEVAAVLRQVHHDRPRLDAVVVAGPDELVEELDRALTPDLSALRAGRLDAVIDTPFDALRPLVADVGRHLESQREEQLVRQLRAALAHRDGAVAGLPATLHALSARRVEHLLVSAGYQATGWRSADGDVLAAVGPRCDLCVEMMVRADDVVEDAIELALRSGTRVTVLAECEDLDVLGHIGGLVRP